MPMFKFTLRVHLPTNAPHWTAYVAAIEDASIDATLKALGVLDLKVSREVAFENWAVREAVDDFLKAAEKVRRGAGQLTENYRFEVLLGDGVQIGEGMAGRVWMKV